MQEKILIACQDDACRNQLLELLSKTSLSIHSVWEDTDLLLELLERDYRVIIYDLEFSTFNGLKMVKIIRKIRPKIALIVISKNSDKELGGKILQEGVVYYGVKPINPNAVKEAISSILKLNNNANIDTN